jgi:hypothetical protein
LAPNTQLLKEFAMTRDLVRQKTQIIIPGHSEATGCGEKNSIGIGK